MSQEEVRGTIHVLRAQRHQVLQASRDIHQEWTQGKQSLFIINVETNFIIIVQGHIKASLGTHGLMKCIFNDWIKQNDVICMPLYRRVFPEWFERSWNPRATLVQKKRKNETYDADEESKEETKDDTTMID